MAGSAPEEGPLGRRLLWFGGLWLVSLLTVLAVAYGARWLFEALGRLG